MGHNENILKETSCILAESEHIRLTPTGQLAKATIRAKLFTRRGLGMTKCVHLIKLNVGSETVADLKNWQSEKRAKAPDGNPRHLTRMWPKREIDLLKGGSIYWVIKGFLQCRQRILRLDEIIGQDGIRRCAIVLDPEIILTTSVKKRPFQGWRYLEPNRAPVDLARRFSEEPTLPPSLAGALADIGVI